MQARRCKIFEVFKTASRIALSEGYAIRNFALTSSFPSRGHLRFLIACTVGQDRQRHADLLGILHGQNASGMS